MTRVVIHALRTAGLVLLAAVVVGPAQSAAIVAGGELAVVRVQRGQAEIVLRDLDGGERVVGRGRNPSWSPDGSSLAFEREGAVWIVAPDGSGERRIGGGVSPSWSPDGTALVFVDRGTLRTVRLLDGETRELGSGQDPEWSSRGVIAFAHDGDIYAIDPDGGGLRRVTGGKPVDSDPAWSPDGARLVFVRDGLIYARAPEPEARARLLARSELPAHDPAWSPDGRYVVYASNNQVCAARQPARQTGNTPNEWLRQRITPTSVVYSQPAWRPHPGVAASRTPVFGRPRLSSTLDCDSSAEIIWQASAIEPGKKHSNALVVVTFVLTNESTVIARDIWFAGYRDGNRLVGLKPARGFCRKPPPLEWECSLGSLAPGASVTVEARFRGRYSAAAGVFASSWDPRLDFHSVEICDIVGTEGDDVLRGTAGTDRICGLGGDDTLIGGDGWDELRGGHGDDRLVGGRGRNALYGDAGDDRLFGGPVRDTLAGGIGADRLDGGSGRDELVGNEGNDLLLARDGTTDSLNGGAGFDRARIDAGLRDRVAAIERLLR